MASDKIIIKGARQHNLKNIDLELPRNKLIIITGLSGSGKSSLAFDTIYAEGQRRYVESLSAYARQFLEQMDKPEVESIEGLSPAISIEQKASSKNPRSTVGTVTEIYDYLRLLFARVGKPHCYQCGRPIASQTVGQIVDRVLLLPEGTRINIMAPLVRGRKGEYRKELSEMQRRGFVRARVDGRWVELADKVSMDKNKKHNIEIVVDRLSVKSAVATRLADSIETALKIADGLVLIEEVEGQEMIFSQRSACIECGVSYPELAPRMFSFNSPYGACPECDGLGSKSVIDPDLIVPDKTLSLHQGAIKPWDGKGFKNYSSLIKALAEHYNFSPSTPFKDLAEYQRNAILYGSNGEEIRFSYERDGKKYYYQGEFSGVVGELEKRYDETWSQRVLEEIDQYMSVRPCAACGGARLRPESLAVKINGLSIADMAKLSVKEARALFARLELTKQESLIGERVLKEIIERLRFLADVGLDYLTLDRAASTLAGGEAQRIRLATQIGSGLVGVLYIMDEPSIGLHQRDNNRLLATLKKLRDLGNTVIVVEHDRETILSGDFVVDLGPGAGVAGGYLVAAGTPWEIMENKKSLTGRYLSGELFIPVPQNRRALIGKFLIVRGACHNNLKSIDVKIPLGAFTCITGVSGSGKSTLLLDIIYRALAHKLNRSNIKPGRFEAIEGLEHLDKVVDVDQSPIGRTPRSNPATYTGVFTQIRELFSQVPEARKRGYKPGRFSFNVKGGRCEACEGDGMIKIEMHFLPDIYVRCEVCKGKRFNRETLEVKYKGCSIAEVLDMTAETALGFFENMPKVKEKLKTICDVGLGYIKLGQSATTLSGGEAQRVKLSKELSRRSTGKTFYILDEPTTGLHFADIQQLLDVLNRLADQGNTVVVIEHNPDVIKQADYIVDLGPEGGDDGGWIVAEGTPEEVVQAESSYTGQFLKKILGRTVEPWEKSSLSVLHIP